jgi:hypothetical protein
VILKVSQFDSASMCNSLLRLTELSEKHVPRIEYLVCRAIERGFTFFLRNEKMSSRWLFLAEFMSVEAGMAHNRAHCRKKCHTADYALDDAEIHHSL